MITKFRAWDIKNLRFVYLTLGFSSEPLYEFEDEFKWEDLDPWEQCIGKVDASGTDIYVGDFVRSVTYPWSKIEKDNLVVFDSTTCGFLPFSHFCDNPEIEGYMPDGKWCNIIGNIHQ